jgi:hypothetical protein
MDSGSKAARAQDSAVAVADDLMAVRPQAPPARSVCGGANQALRVSANAAGGAASYRGTARRPQGVFANRVGVRALDHVAATNAGARQHLTGLAPPRIARA